MIKYILLLFLLTISLYGCRSSILDDPSTVIDYQIAEDSHVTLTLENNYNTIISILVNQDLKAGYYTASVGNKLLAGVYYYTLEARGIHNNYYYKSTKTMLLIK